MSAETIPSAVDLKAERPRCTYNGPDNTLAHCASHCSCLIPPRRGQVLCGHERGDEWCGHPSFATLHAALDEVSGTENAIEWHEQQTWAMRTVLESQREAARQIRGAMINAKEATA